MGNDVSCDCFACEGYGNYNGNKCLMCGGDGVLCEIPAESVSQYESDGELYRRYVDAGGRFKPTEDEYYDWEELVEDTDLLRRLYMSEYIAKAREIINKLRDIKGFDELFDVDKDTYEKVVMKIAEIIK